MVNEILHLNLIGALRSSEILTIKQKYEIGSNLVERKIEKIFEGKVGFHKNRQAFQLDRFKASEITGGESFIYLKEKPSFRSQAIKRLRKLNNTYELNRSITFRSMNSSEVETIPIEIENIDLVGNLTAGTLPNISLSMFHDEVLKVTNSNSDTIGVIHELLKWRANNNYKVINGKSLDISGFLILTKDDIIAILNETWNLEENYNDSLQAFSRLNSIYQKKNREVTVDPLLFGLEFLDPKGYLYKNINFFILPSNKPRIIFAHSKGLTGTKLSSLKDYSFKELTEMAISGRYKDGLMVDEEYSNPTFNRPASLNIPSEVISIKEATIEDVICDSDSLRIKKTINRLYNDGYINSLNDKVSTVLSIQGIPKSNRPYSTEPIEKKKVRRIEIPSKPKIVTPTTTHVDSNEEIEKLLNLKEKILSLGMEKDVRVQTKLKDIDLAIEAIKEKSKDKKLESLFSEVDSILESLDLGPKESEVKVVNKYNPPYKIDINNSNKYISDNLIKEIELSNLFTDFIIERGVPTSLDLFFDYCIDKDISLEGSLIYESPDPYSVATNLWCVLVPRLNTHYKSNHYTVSGIDG